MNLSDFVPEGSKDEFSNLVSYTYMIKLGLSRVTRRPNEILLVLEEPAS